AGLEAVAILPTRVDQRLGDPAILVHLDGVHAAVATLVVVLGDRLVEGAVQVPHAVAQDVGEAQEQREADATALDLLHELLDVHARCARSGRMGDHVPSFVDAEVGAAPVADAVRVLRIGDRPGLLRGRVGHVGFKPPAGSGALSRLQRETRAGPHFLAGRTTRVGAQLAGSGASYK